MRDGVLKILNIFEYRIKQLARCGCLIFILACAGVNRVDFRAIYRYIFSAWSEA